MQIKQISLHCEFLIMIKAKYTRERNYDSEITKVEQI